MPAEFNHNVPSIPRAPNPKLVSTQTFDEYIEYLLKKKYRRIGSGAYADVYVNSTREHVIKTGHRYGNHSYLEFVEHAVANPNNVWMPNINDVGVYTPQAKKADQFFAVAMEVLKPINNKTFETVSTPLEMPADFVRMHKAGIVKFADDGFSDVLHILNKLSRKGHCLDLHAGNVMVRDKQLVVTDPVTD